jgi:hypothetical protein
VSRGKSARRAKLDAMRDSRAGCLVLRWTRSKPKALVGLYCSAEAGLDVEAGPYATVCETHSSIVHHASHRIALSWLPAPSTWCDECQRRSSR